MTNRKRSQRGFTLIEMMVALVLFAAITVGMMSVAITMTNGYRDQEVTIATESSTRAALEFMSQGLRGASPGVADPYAITDATGCGTGINNAFRLESNLTVAGLSSKPDAFTVVMPVGQVLTTTTTAITAGPQVTVSNAAELNAGDQVLITDHATGNIFRIASKSGNTLTFAPTACGALTAPIGSTVIRVMRARFSIDFLPGETVPMLFMDADADGTFYTKEPIAEGIEDMQIAVGIDDDANKIINVENSPNATSDEWHGNNIGDVVYTTQAGVRAIRITLVARTAKEATGVNAYRLPAIEDRAANAATDNFRRRILSSTIEVRNLGGSP
jgi:prepilin-type N-terminal cleavage/methylation domain-containing protein